MKNKKVRELERSVKRMQREHRRIFSEKKKSRLRLMAEGLFEKLSQRKNNGGGV